MSVHIDTQQHFYSSGATVYSIPTISVGAFVILMMIADSGDVLVAPPNITGPSGVHTLYDAVPGDAPNLRIRIDWMYANATSLAWTIDAAALITSDVHRYDDTFAAEFGTGTTLMGPTLTTGNDDTPTTAAVTVSGDPSQNSIHPMWASAVGVLFARPTGYTWDHGSTTTAPYFLSGAEHASVGPGTYGPLACSAASGTWVAVVWALQNRPPPVNRPYGPPLQSTTVIPSVPLAVAGQRQRLIALDESTAVRTGGDVIPTAGHQHIEPLPRVPVPDDQLDALINDFGFARDWPPEHLLPAEITAYSDDFGLDASWTDWMARVDNSRWLTIDGGQATFNQPVGPMIMKLWGWNGRGTPDEPGHVELLDQIEVAPASNLNGRFITASLGDGEHFALYHHLSGVDGRSEESLRLNGTLLAENYFASGDPWDTDVYHPTPGALLLATVFQYGGTGPPSLFGNSLSWVLVDAVGYNLTGVQMCVFRAMSPTATPGQLTVSGMGAARGMVHVSEFTGADTSGSSGSGAIQAHTEGRADESAGPGHESATSFALTLPGVSQNNVAFAAFNNELTTITPGGDYTLLAATADPASPQHAMLTEWATRGLTNVDASAPSVTRWEGVAIEIKKGTPAVIENTLEYRLFSIVNDRIVWDTDFLRWMPDPSHGTGQNYEALVWLDQGTLAYFAVIYPPFGPETLYVNVMDSSGQTLRIDHVTGTATTGVVGSGIASFIVAPRDSKAVYVTYDTYGGFGGTRPIPWQVEWTLAGGFGVIERLDSDLAGILERPFHSGSSIFLYQGRSTSNGASTSEVGAGYGSAFATLFVDVAPHPVRGFILREEINFVGPDTIYRVRSAIFTVGSLMSACQTGIVAVAPFYWEIMSPEGLLFQINEDDVYERFPDFLMDLAVLLNEGAMVAYGQLLHRPIGPQPPFEFRTSVESWRTGRGITTVAGQQRRLNRIGPTSPHPGVLT